jgi:uncharacterized RDD family membrane protein YckC
MSIILYILAILVFLAGTVDVALFLSKNPDDLPLGLVGVTAWWIVGSAILVKAILSRRNATAGSSAGAQSANANYAGFWKRVVASIIDGVLLVIGGGLGGVVVGFTFGFVAGVSGGDSKITEVTTGAVGAILGLFLNWLYFTLFESSSKQATPGKMAISILVTDLQGNPISFGRANGRYWGKIVSSIPLGLGFVMAGVTAKKQALHDNLAGTLVIRK